MRNGALVGALLLSLGWLPASSRANSQAQKDPPTITIPVSDEERAIADSANRFGFRMLAELAKDQAKNAFFSPVSISTALAMTWNGAGGETAAEMARTLELAAMEKDAANRGFRNLLAGVQTGEPKVEVLVANALWLGQGGAFHPTFLQAAQEHYLAEASQVDFADSAAAVGRINDWVKAKTKDKIDKILQPANVDGNTNAVLTNAVYFKGQWTTPFDPKFTATNNFTLADGTTKQFPMMRRPGLPVKTLQTKEFEGAALPYGNGRFRLYVFLPARDSGLKAFLPTITPEKWQEWMAGFRDERKTVVLPRFKVAAEESLVGPLKSMGMKRAFGEADFGPMGFPGSFISEVKHKAVMEVNEEGTTAAAATAVVIARSVEQPFTVDRPFFTAIRDERTGLLLFMGAVWAPDALE